jgi:hypothetical protein
MDSLSKVRIAVPERDVIALDPFEHRIVLHLGTLDMDATFDDEVNPLAQWAAQTYAALMECARADAERQARP